MLPTSLTEWNVIYKNTRLARVSNNNVIIQSTGIASLPATLFPGSYLRSSGEMTRCW